MKRWRVFCIAWYARSYTCMVAKQSNCKWRVFPRCCYSGVSFTNQEVYMYVYVHFFFMICLSLWHLYELLILKQKLICKYKWKCPAFWDNNMKMHSTYSNYTSIDSDNISQTISCGQQFEKNNRLSCTESDNISACNIQMTHHKIYPTGYMKIAGCLSKLNFLALRNYFH